MNTRKTRTNNKNGQKTTKESIQEIDNTSYRSIICSKINTMQSNQQKNHIKLDNLNLHSNYNKNTDYLETKQDINNLDEWHAKNMIQQQNHLTIYDIEMTQNIQAKEADIQNQLIKIDRNPQVSVQILDSIMKNSTKKLMGVVIQQSKNESYNHAEENQPPKSKHFAFSPQDILNPHKAPEDIAEQLLSFVFPHKQSQFQVTLIQKQRVVTQNLVKQIILLKLKSLLKNTTIHQKDASNLKEMSHQILKKVMKTFKRLKQDNFVEGTLDYNSINSIIMDGTTDLSIQKIFNFAAEEQNSRSGFKFNEKNFMNKFIALKKAIRDKKKHSDEIRINLSNQRQKIIDLSHLQENIKKEAKLNRSINEDMNVFSKINKKATPKDQNSQSLFLTIQKNLDRQFEDITSQQHQLELQIESQTHEILRLEIDIIQQTEEKIQLKYYLKEKYIDLLRNDYLKVDQLKAHNQKVNAFIDPYYLVENLKKLKEPLEQTYFPEFLDESSIQYIMDRCLLTEKLDILVKKEKEIQQKYDMSDQMKQLQHQLNNNMQEEYVNEVLKRLRHQAMITDDDFYKKQTQQQLLVQAAGEREKIKSEIEHIQSKKIADQTQEIMRLYNKFSQTQQGEEEKQFLKLKKILKTLLGPTDGEAQFLNFMQSKSILSQKVKKNETFTFSKVNTQEISQALLTFNRNKKISNEQLEIPLKKLPYYMQRNQQILNENDIQKQKQFFFNSDFDIFSQSINQSVSQGLVTNQLNYEKNYIKTENAGNNYYLGGDFKNQNRKNQIPTEQTASIRVQTSQFNRQKISKFI